MYVPHAELHNILIIIMILMHHSTHSPIHIQSINHPQIVVPVFSIISKCINSEAVAEALPVIPLIILNNGLLVHTAPCIYLPLTAAFH